MANAGTLTVGDVIFEGHGKYKVIALDKSEHTNHIHAKVANIASGSLATWCYGKHQPVVSQ